MAKLTLTDITAGFDMSAYNANNSLIEQAIENTLSRDGTTPNTMSAELDMNSNNINNVVDLHTTNLYLNGVKVTGVYPEDLTELGGLLDVTIASAAEDDALMYNAVSAMWENRPLVIADISDFTDNSTNWDTAFSWGDHGAAGYAAGVHTHVVASITDFDPDDYLLNTTDILVGDLSVEGDLDIGVNAGGDSVLNFYDDTNDVNRQIFWDDSESAFFFEDDAGAFQQFGTGSGGGASGPDLLLMGG